MNPKAEEFDPPTVLVIEDDAVLRRGLVRLLRRQGFRVHERSSGGGIRTVIGEFGHPELIICDFRLPGENGLEVMRKIRGEGVNSPFVLITAYFTEELRGEALRSGALSVMEKPLELEVLIDTCRKAVGDR